jgi:putative metalloprotease
VNAFPRRGGWPLRALPSLICCALLAGCENTDLSLATNAAVDAVKAATLSDKDVLEIAARSARESDAKHTLAAADSAYARRLQRLAGGRPPDGALGFTYGVYLSPEVNAFAMADGTIRVYSGLMDLLGDGELQFVVGHEMGHVTKQHIRKKIQLAYATSAVRKGIASQGSAAGGVAGSMLGGVAASLLNAQFSQLEEKEADDAGLAFLRGSGLDLGDAVSALQKLARLSKGHSFLSSHPDPDLRAERLQAQIEGRVASIEESRRGIMGRLQASLQSGIQFVMRELRAWLP